MRLCFPLRRLWYALRFFAMGWRMHGRIHDVATRAASNPPFAECDEHKGET